MTNSTWFRGGGSTAGKPMCATITLSRRWSKKVAASKTSATTCCCRTRHNLVRFRTCTLFLTEIKWLRITRSVIWMPWLGGKPVMLIEIWYFWPSQSGDIFQRGIAERKSNDTPSKETRLAYSIGLLSYLSFCLRLWFEMRRFGSPSFWWCQGRPSSPQSNSKSVISLCGCAITPLKRLDSGASTRTNSIKTS